MSKDTEQSGELVQYRAGQLPDDVLVVVAQAHAKEHATLSRRLASAEAERDEANDNLRMAIDRLRMADPATLKWLQDLDARHMPKSDEGALFTYHGMACVMMPEDALRKMESERDGMRKALEEIPVDDITHAIEALDGTASEFDLLYQQKRVSRLRAWLLSLSPGAKA